MAVYPSLKQRPRGWSHLGTVLVRNGSERRRGVSVHSVSLALMAVDPSSDDSGGQQTLPVPHTPRPPLVHLIHAVLLVVLQAVLLVFHLLQAVLLVFHLQQAVLLVFHLQQAVLLVLHLQQAALLVFHLQPVLQA